MRLLLTFAVAFGFSFVGSIPPGTINLSALQLGLQRHTRAAFYLAIGSSLIEYPYAWIAIKFERLITSQPWMIGHLQLIGAIVLTVLGIISLLPSPRMAQARAGIAKHGFRSGVVLGILNPLAIPYWLGITAYLQSRGWVSLETTAGLHAFLLGVSLGGATLLIVVAHLANRVVQYVQWPGLNRIPGVVLLVLGAYGFLQYYNIV